MDYEEITFKVAKDIHWDNWGKIVKVFAKGQICKGKLYEDGDIIAESPIYEGVSDSVPLSRIKILDPVSFQIAVYAYLQGNDFSFKRGNIKYTQYYRNKLGRLSRSIDGESPSQMLSSGFKRNELSQKIFYIE